MRGETILIVDDEKLLRLSLQKVLNDAGFPVLEAASITEAAKQIKQHDADIIILDQKLPDGTGIDFFRHLKNSSSEIPVIMLTAVDRSDVAVQAMKLGAYDYVTKPVNYDELVIVVEKALESTRLKRQVAHYRKEQEHTYGFCGMLGSSEKMKHLFETITKIAQSKSSTVLLTGESGTGKELAAKAIHFLSERREKPLLSVNCSALSETIIESELFGYEKGAFTDAKTQKRGLFELADSGTIFLDEIGDISLKVQVKLLRVIQEKTFQRVGGTSEISVDVRIIAATNRPLEELVEKNIFREDLYFRLNVVSVRIPSVRERGNDDILLLADYFIHEFNNKFQKNFQGLSDEVKQLFVQYPWKGNVREMKNVLERAILLGEGDYISNEHIEFSQLKHSQFFRDSATSETPTLYELEKRALEQALEATQYNQTHAAKLLGISRDTLRYRMKKFRLPVSSG